MSIRPTVSIYATTGAGPWVTDPGRHCAPGKIEDPDIFFPDSRADDAIQPALNTCRRCPVRPQCRDYALATPGLYGVWGGLTQGERDRMHRRRRFEDAL